MPVRGLGGEWAAAGEAERCPAEREKPGSTLQAAGLLAHVVQGGGRCGHRRTAGTAGSRDRDKVKVTFVNFTSTELQRRRDTDT